jgi:hypothetical protein
MTNTIGADIISVSIQRASMGLGASLPGATRAHRHQSKLIQADACF